MTFWPDLPVLYLFPACAGVIPCRWHVSLRFTSFPRMCGGDPHMAAVLEWLDYFSPHVRG